MESISFDYKECNPVECRFVGGPHDGESFVVFAANSCALLPQSMEWPGKQGGAAGYNRYEAWGDTAWPPIEGEGLELKKALEYRFKDFIPFRK